MEVMDYEARKSPAPRVERLAWIIIVVSFVLFCSLSLSITGVLYYFFFRSATNVDVFVQVSIGSAGVRTPDFMEQVIRDNSPALLLTDRPANISTDAQSQTVISFNLRNANNDDTAVTLTLENSTTLVVTSATQPRYSWSQGDYQIEISEFDGEIDVFVSEQLDEPLRLVISSASSIGSVWISDPGLYSLEANDVSMRLATRQGRAALITKDLRNNRFVTTGEEGILGIGSSTPVISSASLNLVENGLFSFDVFRDPAGNDLFTPVRWGCYDQTESAPAGQSFPQIWDSRSALRLVRLDGAASHGQTGCYQVLAPDRGVDVSEYSFIELQTTFLINYQSLSMCGIDGSECPVMLFIYYTDVNGVGRQWYQGFYYNEIAGTSYPPTCITCGQVYEHKRIAQGVWYTFESGNLISRFPANERPAYIERVVLYASGHQYDVFVSEMSLLAGLDQVVPPEVNIELSTPAATPSAGG